MPTAARTSCEVAGLVAAVTAVDGPASRFDVAGRRVEFDAIVDLLLSGKTPGMDPSAQEAVARAVAAGCLGDRHLWRDLGLRNRASLRQLLETYFAPFASDNVMDMRWKKYIYRKLCRWGGFQTCKAPSCAACPEYAECFGVPGSGAAD
jgi:nitrogen fixation protein NifQ